MLTNEQILEILKNIDPELHQSIVDLNMVRNIKVDGMHVSLDVILTIQGCPLKAKIQQDIEQALKRNHDGPNRDSCCKSWGKSDSDGLLCKR